MEGRASVQVEIGTGRLAPGCYTVAGPSALTFSAPASVGTESLLLAACAGRAAATPAIHAAIAAAGTAAAAAASHGVAHACTARTA